MDIFNHLFITFMPYFCVLALSTIALIISERAGIVNIGINGIIVMGASFYMIFAHLFSNKGSTSLDGGFQILLFLFAACGGILMNLLIGFAVIRLKANQVIAGIALNILAPAITIAILFIFGTAQRLPFTVEELALGNAANFEPFNFVSLKMIVTLFVISIFFVLLRFTKWGLRFKSVGENPQASDVAGINVNATKWKAILISGALAGLAGGIYIASLSSGNTFKGNVEGLGYLAIAIMIIGRWNIIPSMIAVIIFSTLFSLGFQFSYIFPNEKNSIISIIKMLPYLITILILVLFSKPSLRYISKIANKMSIQSNGPKAAGEPYDKSKR